MTKDEQKEKETSKTKEKTDVFQSNISKIVADTNKQIQDEVDNLKKEIEKEANPDLGI